MQVRFKGMFLSIAVFLVAWLTMLFGVKPVLADTTYVVQPGDSLWKIAQSYHVSIQSIKEKNQLSSDVILIHQKLLVTTVTSTDRTSRSKALTPSRSHPTARQATRQQKSGRSSKAIVHLLGIGLAPHQRRQPVSYEIREVQPGDTLWAFASAYNTSVNQLEALNHLTSDTIYVGQRLRVFAGTRAAIRRLTFQRLRRLGMPLQLLPVYQAAGRKYGVSWKVLAAIHRVETNYATGYEVSPAGAEGPMQFMPSTFRVYGVAAPGHHGSPDINNVADAIYSCAHMLAADGYARNPSMALFAYNHSFSYVRTVEAVEGSL